MGDTIDEEMSLRAYLLGELPPDEQIRIEERLLMDADYIELLLILEEELMDSYVSNALSGREQERFENHFMNSPERRRKLRMAKGLRRYVNNRQRMPAQAPVRGPWSNVFWTQPLRNPAWRAAVAAVIVLGFGLTMWRIFLYQSPIDKGRAALQAALRESPIEGRMASFQWRPQSATLGSPSNAVVDKFSMDRAFSYFREADGPDSHYALGQYYLAKGEPDSAIEQFGLALEAMPRNAKLHNDLGAALLALANRDRVDGDQRKDPDSSSEYLFQSLEHFDQALELDPSLLEALFNRALSRQRLQLLSEAEADWRTYLSRDANSPWAEAARQHLDEIGNLKKFSKSKEEQFKDFLKAYETGDREAAWAIISQTRELINGSSIWWQLLDDFFELRATGQQTEADARIKALEYVGSLELNLGEEEGEGKGDPYISGLAEFYRSSSAQQQSDLYEAHKRMNEGNELYLKDKISEALGSYTQAREIFARVGDRGEAMLADLLIGYCRIQNGETDKSIALFRQLVGECQDKGYRWLLAQSFFSLGIAEDFLADHSKSLVNTSLALQISEEMGDGYNIQRSLAQIADQYRKLGNYKLSTTFLNRCLKQMGVTWPGKRQMWRNCDQLTQILTARRLNAAAAAYANEALRLALESDDPSFIYVSYLNLGLIRSKRQDHAEAIKLAQQGFDAAPGNFQKAYASLQMGHLYGQAKNWGQALSSYDRSLEYIDSIEARSGSGSEPDEAGPKTNRLPAWRYDAHKGRLFCLFAEGDDAQAQEELDRTLKLLEKYRENIQEEQNRNTFFSVEQDVYDAAINFEYSKRNNNRAVFEYSEKSRARSLLDLINNARARAAGGQQLKPNPILPLNVEEARQRLPEHTQLIEYSVLDDKVLICLVSKSEFRVEEARIGLNDLTDRVLNFRRSILRLTSEPSSESQSLYDLLIKPINLSPTKGKQICIVPDKVLNNLPFYALISPDSGRYIIRDYQVMFAPSATTYLACSERTNHTTDLGQERLLAIGAPTFDRKSFPLLPALPSTGEQVEQIGKLYLSPSVLTGGMAREEVIKREVEEADVIHLASHYVVFEGDPMNSRLLLAQEPPNPAESDNSAGFLRADEVYGLNLRHDPLVVLSACQTGVEHYYNGEGMIGMSRVFIAAGAPVVVASLWPVDVYATNTLMIDFHRYRKLEKRSTVEALRLAQLDMLDNPLKQHPYYWAGFTAIGGQTTF